MLEEKPIGNITIAVQDDEFLEGYQAGYLRFRTYYQGKMLSEGDMHLFLARNYFDGSATERYNIGYITGWYAALFIHEPEQAHVAVQPPPLQGGHP
jgi:hypothetical protein